MLFSLPEVAERYASCAPAIFSSAPTDTANDLPTQLAKVGVALVTGRTGKPTPAAAPAATPAAPANGDAEPMDTDGAAAAAAAAEEAAAAAAAAGEGGSPQDAAHLGGGKSETALQEANSVRPAAIKALVGKGHPEFSSGRQQVGSACLY